MSPNLRTPVPLTNMRIGSKAEYQEKKPISQLENW